MNKLQFTRFEAMVQPGDVIFTSANTFVLKLIVAGQQTTDKTWTNQLGHTAFIDDNWDIQESSIDKVNGVWKSGILIRPLKAWFDGVDNQKFLVIMRLKDITQDQIKAISNKGRELQKQNIKYPVAELVGTLTASINYNFLGLIKWMNPKFIGKCQEDLLMKQNPLSVKNKAGDDRMYCIAFANHCFEFAGMRLIPMTVNESICKVGDGLRNALAYTLKFVVPFEYKDYIKEAGQSFDLDIKA